MVNYIRCLQEQNMGILIILMEIIFKGENNMPELIFIRHAESECNRDVIFAGRIDCALTKNGIEQAKNVLKDGEKNFDDIMYKNLGIIKLEDRNYRYYLENKKINEQ